MPPLLTIGYSCLAERAGEINQPETSDNVDFVVCVQGDDPKVSIDWARVMTVDGFGVAKSRNAVIDAATGQFLLFCDDDVTVNMSGVTAGIRHLEQTGHAIALGRGINPSGITRKNYPKRATKLTKFNTAKTATYEMLIDVAQVRAEGIRFDERFGAGAEFHLGDEYIFAVEILRAGLVGEAIPEVFGTHPDASSGERWDDANDAHVRAVALNHVFGHAAPLIRAAFAVKHRHNLGGMGSVLKFCADNSRPPIMREHFV